MGQIHEAEALGVPGRHRGEEHRTHPAMIHIQAQQQVMEGISSMIAEIMRRARGFSDVENLISMCYLVSTRRRPTCTVVPCDVQIVAPGRCPGRVSTHNVIGPFTIECQSTTKSIGRYLQNTLSFRFIPDPWNNDTIDKVVEVCPLFLTDPFLGYTAGIHTTSRAVTSD